MTDRNELVQCIADVLKHNHRFVPVNASSIGSEDHCGCGLRPRGWQAWADHVADEVVSVLPTPDIDKVAAQLKCAEMNIYANVGPSPVLVPLREAMRMIDEMITND